MNDPCIISVGGGKGGVGKSTITANVGTLLARKGFSVGFIDADLGGANLHLCLGVRRPASGLQDYLRGKAATLKHVAVATSTPGSWLISGASDILELANPNFAQKKKIITNLAKMEADYIFVDLGAGSSAHVTDFYAAFPFGIVVTDGLPTSIENAYGFLKNGILRGLSRLFVGNTLLQNRIKCFADAQRGRAYATVNELLDGCQLDFPQETQQMRLWLHERRTLLVLNMVKESEDIKVGTRFADMVKKYLAINLTYIGYVLFSTDVRKSMKAMRPLVEDGVPSRMYDCFETIAQNIVALTKGHG